ncbi:hypothetical protein [Brevundimonas sp.]|uniref:hypothetical protein n=1 Tax=Brevundimonas sp. TaxID=1871086 RepID=UPI0025BA88EF|nr:hypothetical protein [Brevundimonas sp.]
MLSLSPQCPVHGRTLHRETCRACNAAYMRGYLQDRRRRRPAREIWERARKRARRLNLTFNLPRDSIVIPPSCPVLGLPLQTGGKRSERSPSLDRIRPQDGYVVGNVRVVSDRANRLKGALDLPRLEARAAAARGVRRQEYDRLVEYVRRETLLSEVRAKAALGGRTGQEWDKIARFLEKAFVRADWAR